MNPYFYIAGTLIFTVYGQIILKWRLSQMGALPAALKDKLWFMVGALLDPFIISGFVAAFLASVCWMAAMTSFELTKAYPFMSLAPALVFIIGVGFMGETYTPGKVVGLLLIAAGTYVTVKF
jgi:undecaprenyl phosphate-alpha-L-ara4N flippase subunit ArnF